MKWFDGAELLECAQIEVGVQFGEHGGAQVEEFELEQIHQKPVGIEQQILNELADERDENGQAGANYMHSPDDSTRLTGGTE